MPVLQRYNELPDIPSGYALDDVWSVVIPIARTNLVINPSFETNTTSWTAIGGSIARSTTQQYHGAYSLAITPTATTTDGARFDTVSLTSGTTYAYSAKVRGVAGLQYSISIETTGGVAVATKTFLATGRWQWIVGYYTETSTTTRRFTARKAGSNASVAIFYLDGVQVEAIVAGELASTYIDGDQLGLVPNQNPVPYYWNGTPHASTSARSGLTRAGGMVIPFKRFGFLLVAMIGLGIATPQNTSFEYARIDGGYDDYTRKPSDQFTLTGRFQGRTYAELRRNRSGLGQYFDRDLVAQDQRLTLLHHIEDHNGNTISSEARILAKYAGGFEGKNDNMHAEQVSMTFTQYLPVALADGESGAALNVQQTVTANFIVQRSPAGVWSAVGAGVSAGGGWNSRGFKGAVGLDGAIYVGGDFTAMAGVANTLHIAKWTPSTSTWSAMGTGATGNRVTGMATAPDGQIIACGDIATGFGGIANTANLARWTGSAWQSITAAGSANGIVRQVAFDSLGNLYAVGTFTTINGVAANRVAKMTPAGVWSALGAGLTNNGATAIGIDKSNNVFIGGDFTLPFPNFVKWNGTAFSAVGGTGPNGITYAITFAPNGNMYVVGTFTTVGGLTTNDVAMFNGVQWSALSTGLSAASNGYAGLYDPVTNLLYIGGSFTTAGPITPPDSFVVWNGASFVYPDIDFFGTPDVALLLRGLDGTLYVGMNTSGNDTVSGTATITNPGTARSYPTITINGPTATAARVFSILNTTTNRAIYLNLTMSVGETATLVFKPDQLSFTSTFQGTIANTILPGSNAADFFLAPGVNVIQFFSADSTVTATLFFRPAYLSIDDVP